MGNRCYCEQSKANDTNKKNNPSKTNSPSIPLDIIKNISKGVCHIYIKKTEEYGTGFFMEINPQLKCLLTIHQILRQELIDLNPIIVITKNSIDKIELKLNKDERYIRCLENLGVTVVEIMNSDGLSDFDFLTYDQNYKDGYNNYSEAGIFTLQSEENFQSGTLIFNENNYINFTHNAFTDEQSGSSGSPIVLLSNSRIIGIHKGNNEGTFIGGVVDEINKDLKEKKTKELLKKSNNNNNYIIAEILIDGRNINKDILIINSYENLRGKLNSHNYEEKLKNEKEIKECDIEINGKIINFSYFYKFNREGKYRIIYYFNNLKNSNHLFCECSSIININLSKFNTSNITNMSYMFGDCKLLTNINISNINTQNVTDIEGMFYGCSSLLNLEISNFDTKNITNMSYAFGNCSSLRYLDLSNFDTQNVYDMSSMFDGCSSLGNIFLSNFNTNNVIDMSCMFANCSSLEYLDLSTFVTLKVIYMEEMFFGCEQLNYLNLSNFNTQNIKKMGGFFTCCDSLEKENLITEDNKIVKEFSSWEKLNKVGEGLFKDIFK